jgi:DNA repair exonuclease SbcCD nuclease subunit
MSDMTRQGTTNGYQQAATQDLVLIHSSDLHLGVGHNPDDHEALHSVIAAARSLQADVLLLAGDIFDHNRLSLPTLDAAARVLGDAGLPIVILPGNHDCLAPNSVYRRGGLADPANVHVLGITADNAVTLPGLDLEIWGRPHLDHVDMSPFADPRPRGAARWNVATGHGHWVTGPHDHHRSWKIHEEELAALDTDYVALGHWDRAVRVGDGDTPVYYSGSPDLARTVNVVRFAPSGLVDVNRHPLNVT